MKFPPLAILQLAVIQQVPSALMRTESPLLHD